MVRTAFFQEANRSSILRGAAMNPRADYQAAKAMRMQGKSYGEIRKVFGIPKSTQSSWFKDLALSRKAKKILETKQKAQFLQLGEFNKRRSSDIAIENEEIRLKHEKIVGKLSDRELMLLGAALYWGEGYKNFGEKVYKHLAFGNSEPLMIKVFLKFMKKILGIEKNRVKAQVMIYAGMNPQNAIKYWQLLTLIPKENFRTQLAASRSSQSKRPFNFLPFGTLQLRVYPRQEFFKVKGFIDGIIKSTT